MPENKKPVVIRVNLAKNNITTSARSSHRMVTDWHFGRLALVIGLLLVLVFVVYGVFMKPDPNLEIANKAEKDEPIVIRQAIKPVSRLQNNTRPELTNETKQNHIKVLAKQKRVSIANEELSAGVTRARLAQGVANREPFGQIDLPVKVNKEFAVGIFYFTELNGMKGQTVWHRWTRKGKVVFEKKKVILGNRWRTYTSKLLTAYSTGSWVVELTNQDGYPLHRIEFEVVME